MTCTVRIPSALQRFTGGTESLQTDAGTLPALLQDLTGRFPDLKDRLCEPDGRPRRFFNVYVNDEDIRFLGGDAYAFSSGDEILILPSIAGGRG